MRYGQIRFSCLWKVENGRNLSIDERNDSSIGETKIMICSSFQWMRIVFSLLLLFFIQVTSAEPLRRQDPESIFYKATLFYEAAKYEEAINQYSLLLNLGFESGPLYYNLGNCYFKRGNL